MPKEGGHCEPVREPADRRCLETRGDNAEPGRAGEGSALEAQVASGRAADGHHERHGPHAVLARWRAAGGGEHRGRTHFTPLAQRQRESDRVSEKKIAHSTRSSRLRARRRPRLHLRGKSLRYTRCRSAATVTVVSGGARLRNGRARADRKSTRLNSSHQIISYAVFCLKKKNSTPHQ